MPAPNLRAPMALRNKGDEMPCVGSNLKSVAVCPSETENFLQHNRANWTGHELSVVVMVRGEQMTRQFQNLVLLFWSSFYSLC